jgi:DNA repair exonuclease SbcCD ATPase subunit
MNIKLQTLTLHNFRGIRDLTVELRGGNASISGPNASGKTSVIDAFTWLLFNIDSEKYGQLDPKTTIDGRPVHNLDHEVEAILSVDGKRVTLRKLYKEKWTRSRGSSQQVFDGHTTDHWINDEPVKAKDFAAYVASLIDVERFKMITSPLYFSEKLHWEQRRKTLLDMCSEISPEAVMDACTRGDEEARAKLVEILTDRSVETARKVIQDRRRRVNDELEKIPAQIEAVTRTIPELTDNYAEAEAALAVCRDEIADLDAQMQNASRALEPIREKGRELARMEQELAAIAGRMDREARSGHEDAVQTRKRTETQLQQQEGAVERAANTVGRLTEKKVHGEAELANLRGEHERVYVSAFMEPSDDALVCEACGQDLPADKRAQLISDARSRFETKKAADLQAIKDKGLRIREAHDATLSDLEAANTDLASATTERDRLVSALDRARADEATLTPTGTVDYTANPQYVELGAKIAALRAELETPPLDATADISAQRAAVNGRIEEHMKTLSLRDAAARSREEIESLTARERELSDQITELDGQLFSLEAYVRTEAELLESSINAKFRTIRFKLFDEQINGGLRPTCEAVVNGVQFSEANTADQFNAGMEIIDALCRHYKANAPVFVDRCESINSLTPIDSQVIRMVVVSDDAMAEISKNKGAVVARAARSSVCIQHENIKQEVA